MHSHLCGVLFLFLSSFVFFRIRDAVTAAAAVEAARPARAARERRKRAAELLLPPTETKTRTGTGVAARERGGGRLTAVTARAMTATVAAAAVARVQGKLFTVDRLQRNLWYVGTYLCVSRTRWDEQSSTVWCPDIVPSIRSVSHDTIFRALPSCIYICIDHVCREVFLRK